MTDANEPPPPARVQSERAPYEKPAIAWEESLDVRPGLMIACVKIAFTSAECDAAAAS